MEQALRIQSDDEPYIALDASKPRADAETMPDAIEKVLRFATPAARAVETASPAIGPVTAREFAAAIDVVHEAAQSIRAAEERTREAEARTYNLAQHAAEELKNAELRIQTLEARARAAEVRAQEAEARAKEADGWLRQIFATLAEELPVRRSVQAD